jgi:sodium transport system permease protein
MNESAPHRHDTRLNWRQVAVLYQREMRGAFREKTIVINSILIPIFLYPFLLWVAFTGMTLIIGQTEDVRSRVAIGPLPQEHPGLRRRLERHRDLQLFELSMSRKELERRIRLGALDAGLEFLPAESNSAPAANFRVRLTVDQSKENSLVARDRLKNLIDQYRRSWLRREAVLRRVDVAAWQGFTLSSLNVASKKQMGSFVLGLILPVIFVVMVAIGCFYPAVDALAGERERNTWETLISTAASRVSIVTAKYLYVASLGGLAGALNLMAVLLTFKPILAPIFDRAGKSLETTFPLAAIPLLGLAAILLAGFVSAGMMIFAAFARTFREGQAMITPFYMLILVPVVFLQVPGLKLSLPMAFLPVFNLTLMIREAVSGTFHWLPICVALAVSVALIGLCIRLAAFILRFEDVVVGSFNGSFGRFLGQRILKRRQAPGSFKEVAR